MSTINRQDCIQRHNPHYKKLNKNAPLSVGNGTFTFTADFTGLQTFFDDYSAASDAFPLCTMSEWSWHSYPRIESDEANLRLTPLNTYGRNVNYAMDNTGQEELFKRIRVNEHKFNLGKISFELHDKKLALQDFIPVSQQLSLWEGILYSEFSACGTAVKTETFVHNDEDSLFIKVSSPLLKNGNLRITICFPYGSHKKNASDFTVPDIHTTNIIKPVKSDKTGNEQPFCLNNYLCLERKLNDTVYRVTINGKNYKTEINEQKHLIHLIPDNECIEFCIKFEPVNIPSFIKTGISFSKIKSNNDSYNEAKTKCRSYWEKYWNNGGFIDFSGSTDKRAFELERRIILSQYLIAIQSRGNVPPAETGHTCNSWYGKFHLEMHFWHHAHFALWNRIDEVKKALDYYKKILPVAKEIASSQGYSGARWPKMCDPTGRNTPSSVAVLLIWQQPHPIMFAELIRRNCGSDSAAHNNILNEYIEIITETAEFMKSFIHYDGERYVVGPPYIPAQERHDPRVVINAAYELEYFRLGFKIADNWLEKLGEKKRYGEIADKLSLPSVKEGVYLAHENCPNTFSELPFYTDHPSMLAMYGVLSSDKIDRDIMSATLDKVLEVWDKKTFYGWDFPVMAMTACRLGRYKDAVDLLLMDSPKNTYMENGHNRMVGDDALPCYLPGNGGLLLAAAMMAAGFDGKSGPLFPEGFTVNVEEILPYI